MTDGRPVSIAEAICSDVDQSRDIYEWVMDVCLALGVEASVLVPFDRYRAAVAGLSLPSSLARGLHGGAIAAERLDKLIQALARCRRMQHPLLDTIVGDVNFLTTRLGSVISHDVIIEDHVFIGPGVVIGGGEQGCSRFRQCCRCAGARDRQTLMSRCSADPGK